MHAILVHGWRGWPENAWFPWLRKELESRGWTVDAPTMPQPMTPERHAWVATLERTVQEAIQRGILPPKITLVGHSLGCPTILQMLERHQGKPFAQVVLVSGFARNFGAPGVNLWMDRDIDFENIHPKVLHWSVLHGKGDVVVPVPEGQWLADQLGVPLTHTEWPGHFMHEEGITKLPEVLHAVVSFS